MNYVWLHVPTKLFKVFNVFYYYTIIFCVVDAAYGLVNAKGRLFHVGSNNALLQFLLDVSKLLYYYFLKIWWL